MKVRFEGWHHGDHDYVGAVGRLRQGDVAEVEDAVGERLIADFAGLGPTGADVFVMVEPPVIARPADLSAAAAPKPAAPAPATPAEPSAADEAPVAEAAQPARRRRRGRG